jgi:uncharacterized membrane protein
MGLIALHVVGTSSYPAFLPILVVVVLVAAVYFISREYFNRRFNRRDWK